MESLPPIGLSAPVVADAGRPAARTGGTVFSLPARSAPGRPAPVNGAGLSGLLALQEADADAVRDREARRHGQDLLSELAALQRELLDGPPGAARLQALAGLADAVPEAADPRLRDVVASIALRARIELARYARHRA